MTVTHTLTCPKCGASGQTHWIPESMGKVLLMVRCNTCGEFDRHLFGAHVSSDFKYDKYLSLTKRWRVLHGNSKGAK